MSSVPAQQDQAQNLPVSPLLWAFPSRERWHMLLLGRTRGRRVLQTKLNMSPLKQVLKLQFHSPLVPEELWSPPPPPPCSQLRMNICLGHIHVPGQLWHRFTGTGAPLGQATPKDFHICKHYTGKPQNPCVDGLSIIHHSFLAVEREGDSP